MLALYQREFVEQNINRRVHMLGMNSIIESGEQTEILKEAIENQDVVPYIVGDNYVSMSGAEFVRPGTPEWDENDQTFVKKIEGVIANANLMSRAVDDCDANELLAAIPTKKAATRVIENASEAAKKANDCAQGSGETCSSLRHSFREASNRLKRIETLLKNKRSLHRCPAIRSATKRINGRRLEKFESDVKSFQSIEAFRKKGDNVTTVTATWSDEYFDLKKVRTKHYGFPVEKEKQATVPLCVGCRRTWIYKGTGKEKPFGHEMLESQESPGVLADFYRNEMAKDGWKLSDGAATTLALMKRKSSVDRDKRWLHFARGDEHITFRIHRASGVTKVTATRTD